MTITAPATGSTGEVSHLEAELDRRGARGALDASTLARALYSTDASLYCWGSADHTGRPVVVP